MEFIHASCKENLMQRLERVDPEIARLITTEHKRQNETLGLIASENHVSIPVS